MRKSLQVRAGQVECPGRGQIDVAVCRHCAEFCRVDETGVVCNPGLGIFSSRFWSAIASPLLTKS